MKRREPETKHIANEEVRSLRLINAEITTVINVIVNDLAGLQDLDALLAEAAEKIAVIFPIDGVAIYLLDVAGGSRIKRQIRRGKIPTRESSELAKEVLRRGIAVKNLLVAIPIVADDILGAVVIRRCDRFNEVRIDLLEAITHFLATRILEIHGRSTLALQLPQTIARRLPLDARQLTASARRITATVLFADVRNFTSLSERISPEILQRFLNRYFTVMERIVKDRGGIVVKFLAGGILAAFGVPERDEQHTLKAVRCALEMIEAFQKELTDSIPPEKLKLGIGLARGAILTGYFGSPERLAFDVLGDIVNTAARIQGTAENALLINTSAYRAVRGKVEATILPPPNNLRVREENRYFTVSTEC